MVLVGLKYSGNYIDLCVSNTDNNWGYDDFRDRYCTQYVLHKLQFVQNTSDVLILAFMFDLFTDAFCLHVKNYYAFFTLISSQW